ncbi:phosphatase PAP2 family protein [Compostibacter hankyongensis]|uniref:Phosphatidic acid phosphatase type 2/haloperoxidase domain-containing protein n=1 Tax=Compostibacter hankyongensis TaxID=1007089 RepID=A0ABP8FR14_9BACT
MKYLVLLCILLAGYTTRSQSMDSLAFGKDSILISQKPLRFTFRQTFIPAGLLVSGIATTDNGRESLKNEIAEERNEHFSSFRTHLDNYMQFSPIAVAYGLDAIGIKSKTDMANRTVILLKGEALMYGVVTLLKNTTHELRPDGTNRTSFPSGHTAQAFAAATFLSEEYKDRFKWMPYAAYGLASGVGALRLANNKHYLCDVLVGAGIGILSMKIAYWTHKYKWGKKRMPSKIYHLTNDTSFSNLTYDMAR